MADRPKPKTTHGERNAARRNGKAPKKHPKSPAQAKSEATTWSARKEARRKARLKGGKRQAWERRQARAMDAAQRLAIAEDQKRARLQRQSEAAKKQAKAAEHNARMVEAMKNGGTPQ